MDEAPPRRAPARVVTEDEVFVPHWSLPDGEEDLRAPFFGPGGVALAEPSPPAAEAEAAPVFGPGQAGAARGGEASPVPDEGGGEPAFVPTAPAMSDWRPPRPASRPEDLPRVIKGDPPEPRGMGPVILACAIGVLIAALIVAAAFMFRPG
ncbi:hypothetical protein [Amaricoccus solimangrovi]|uniref:Uncharacterized protein n=1 Tax=Amaricoccus solimangrovi TaxID=2589815 RepID=A0A501WSL5_9RHOB|nr:hypothetical protein [Amaricoccus solimangrovi]TPE52713.1 hypothetical protein FJM51_05945 [Amaricoccus solimangrovi]